MATRAIIRISEPTADDSLSTRLYEIKQWPVTIGRALDNDLILTDPFVAPHHARVDQEGDAFRITALQTDNGIELESGEQLRADEQQAWQEGKSAHIGQVRLNLVSEATSLAPEQSLAQASALNASKKATEKTTSDQRLASAHQAKSAEYAVPWQKGLQLMAFLLLALTGEGFISHNPDVFVLNTLKTAGSFIGGLLLWSLVWGLLTKVFSGSVRFGAHFFTAVKAVIVMQLTLWVLHAAAFAFSIEMLSQFDSILFIFMLGWLLMRHLNIALGGSDKTGIEGSSKRTTKLIQYGVVSLMLGAIALSLVVRYNATGRFTDGLYLGTFMPPSWRLHKAKAPEVLDQGMAALKERTDKLLVKDGTSDADLDTEE
jgi:FHA domain